ncbi:MAG: cytochrome c-type biogenesis protein [Acidimicrobiales bacterium]
MSSSGGRSLAWVAMAAVVLVLLVFGTLGRRAPSDSERAQALARSIRCPSCKSQSVATSDTPSSQGVRELIRRRIVAGDSDEEIRDFVAVRYPGTLLDPPGRGFGALVWALPVVGAIVAVAALVLRFGDWRQGTAPVTDADRDLVAKAQASVDSVES